MLSFVGSWNHNISTNVEKTHCTIQICFKAYGALVWQLLHFPCPLRLCQFANHPPAYSARSWGGFASWLRVRGGVQPYTETPRLTFTLMDNLGLVNLTHIDWDEWKPNYLKRTQVHYKMRTPHAAKCTVPYTSTGGCTFSTHGLRQALFEGQPFDNRALCRRICLHMSK